MNMLDEVAGEAARMAEAQTQPEGLDTEVDNMEIDSSTQVAGHCVRRLAVADCEDGGPEGRAIRIDDYENTIFEGKTTWNGSDETGQITRPNPNHIVDLLQEMTLLCQTVQCLGKQMQDLQNLGRQMQDGFAAESRKDKTTMRWKRL